MSTKVMQVENQIIETVKNAIVTAQKGGELAETEIPEFKIEIPNDRSHGDYAVNAAMVGAKAFKTAPRMIAEAIVKNLNTENTYIKSVEIAGPGFINI
ncbi:MAG: arginine--tRNA ligase, partial [Clostridia bacterium]|nr:arginine--tRNA ligase [Clostridia bacterium]